MRFLSIVIVVTIHGFALYAQERLLVRVAAFPNYEGESSSDDYLIHPFDLGWYGGRYFVTDAVEHCIKVFSPHGKLERIIGTRGKGPGELLDPFVLAVNPIDGRIACEDGGNRRISCFTSEGRFLRSFRTVYPVYALLWHGNRIYAAAYNEQTQTLFTMYDTTGSIEQLFGDFFDSSVNELNYRSYLYSPVYFRTDGHHLYVFYQFLPVVQVYQMDGSHLRTLRFRTSEAKRVWAHNMDPDKVVVSPTRFAIRRWNLGGGLLEKHIIIYTPLLKGLSFYDVSGQLVETVRFQEEVTRPNSRNFIGILDDRFVFVDVQDAQVVFYRLTSAASEPH